VRMQPRVVEAGHHSRQLQGLTGLLVEDNQARRLLNDMAAYAAHLGRGGEDRAVVAHRWLTEIYEPIIALIPSGLRRRLEPAEVFHQVLEHRWYLSERAGRAVPLLDAAASYVEDVLTQRPDEALAAEPPA